MAAGAKYMKLLKQLPHSIIQEERSQRQQHFINGILWSRQIGDVRGVDRCARLLSWFYQYNIPEDSLVAVIQVLYKLVVTSPCTNVVMEARVCSVLLGLLRRAPMDVALDWRPCFGAICRAFFTDEQQFLMMANSKKGTWTAAFKNLIKAVSRRVPDRDAPEIMDAIEPWFAPRQTCRYRALVLLKLLPRVRDTQIAIPILTRLLTVWQFKTNSFRWDINMMEIMSRIVKAQMLQLRGDATPLLPLLERLIPHTFTCVLRALDISVPSTKGSQKIQTDKAPAYCQDLGPTLGSSCARLLVWLANSQSDQSLRCLEQLAAMIRDYFHPSNAGPWQEQLGSLLFHCCRALRKRTDVEQREGWDARYALTEAQRVRFVRVFMPLAKMGVYSKNNLLGDLSKFSLPALCSVPIGDDDKVLRSCLKLCVAALLNLNSSHQTTDALKLMMFCGRGIARSSCPIVHKYVREVVTLLPFAIDTNDVQKTFLAIRFVSGFMSSIVLSNPITNPTRPVDFLHNEIVENGFLVDFMTRLFEFLSFKEKPSKKPTEHEQHVRSEIRLCSRVLMSNVVGEPGNQLHTRLMAHITNSTVPNALTEYRYLVESSFFANPNRGAVLEHELLPLVQRELDGGVSEDRAVWLLSLAADAVGHAGSEIAAIEEKTHIFDKIYQKIRSDTRRRVVKAGCQFIKCFLRGLVTFYPREMRPVGASAFAAAAFTSPTDMWGLAPDRHNLDVEWHVPSPAQVALAQTLAQHVLLPHLELFESLAHYAHASTYTCDITNATPTAATTLATSVPSSIAATTTTTATTTTSASTPASGAPSVPTRFDLIKSTRIIWAVFRGIAWSLPAIATSPPDHHFSDTGRYVYDFAPYPMMFPVTDFCSTLRQRIHDALHYAFSCVRAVFPDGVKVMEVLLKAAAVVLCKSLGVSNRKTMQYGSSLRQCKLGWLRFICGGKPSIPRWYYVSKLHIIHVQYLAFMHDSLSIGTCPSQRALINDILECCFQPYRTVRQRAQTIIVNALPATAVNHRRFVVQRLLRMLASSDDQAPDCAVKGAAHALARSQLLRHVSTHSEFICQLSTALCGLHKRKSETLVGQVVQLFPKFLQGLAVLPPISMAKPEVAVWSVPADKSELAERFFEDKSQKQSQMQIRTVGALLELVHSSTISWNFKMMALSFSFVLIRPQNMWHAAGFVLGPLLRGMVDDLMSLRLLARCAAQLTFPGIVSITRPRLPSQKPWPRELSCAPKQLSASTATTSSTSAIATATASSSSSVTNRIQSPLTMADLQVLSQTLENTMTPAYLDRWLSFLADDNTKVRPMVHGPALATVLNGLLTRCSKTSVMQDRGPGQFQLSVSRFFKFVAASGLVLWRRILSCGTELLSKDRREFHTVAAEIFCALIRAIRRFPSTLHQQLFSEVLPALRAGLSQANGEAVIDWRFCLVHANVYRETEFMQPVLDMLLEGIEASARSSTESGFSVHTKWLQYLSTLLYGVRTRTAATIERVLDLLERGVLALASPYHSVRMEVASMIAAAFLESSEPYSPPAPQLSRIIAILAKPANSRMTETALNLANINFAGNIFSLEMMAVAFEGLREPEASPVSTQDTIVRLANAAVRLAGQVCVPESLHEGLVTLLVRYRSDEDWRVRRALPLFCQVFLFSHKFSMAETLRLQICELMLSLLSDTAVEVCTAAARAISSLVRGGSLAASRLLPDFLRLAAVPFKTDPRERRAGVLGLCALVQASPYEVAEWLPRVLESLAVHQFDPSPIKDSVLKTLAEFWRTHQDAWEKQREKFSSELIDSIKMQSSHNYFV